VPNTAKSSTPFTPRSFPFIRTCTVITSPLWKNLIAGDAQLVNLFQYRHYLYLKLNVTCNTIMNLRNLTYTAYNHGHMATAPDKYMFVVHRFNR